MCGKNKKIAATQPHLTRTRTRILTFIIGMRSCILVAAVALGQLYADGAITWYEPADGVPLSGLESSQACESRGQRLCYYDELCPSGEDTAPVGMPSSHSDYMPFLSTTYGRRWMGGDCRVHEDLYNEDCYVHGCGTGSPCANECCDHGWCTTPGADGCDSASGSSLVVICPLAPHI